MSMETDDPDPDLNHVLSVPYPPFGGWCFARAHERMLQPGEIDVTSDDDTTQTSAFMDSEIRRKRKHVANRQPFFKIIFTGVLLLIVIFLFRR